MINTRHGVSGLREELIGRHKRSPVQKPNDPNSTACQPVSTISCTFTKHKHTASDLTGATLSAHRINNNRTFVPPCHGQDLLLGLQAVVSHIVPFGALCEVLLHTRVLPILVLQLVLQVVVPPGGCALCWLWLRLGFSSANHAALSSDIPTTRPHSVVAPRAHSATTGPVPATCATCSGHPFFRRQLHRRQISPSVALMSGSSASFNTHVGDALRDHGRRPKAHWPDAVHRKKPHLVQRSRAQRCTSTFNKSRVEEGGPMRRASRTANRNCAANAPGSSAGTRN